MRSGIGSQASPWVVERRGVADGDEQPLRAQKSVSDLHPQLGAGLVDEPMALGGEFGGCGGHIRDLELDAGLGDRDVGRPYGGARTGCRRFREGPQAEMCPRLRVCRLRRNHPHLHLRRGRLRCVPFQPTGCVDVPHDWGHTLATNWTSIRFTASSQSLLHWVSSGYTPSNPPQPGPPTDTARPLRRRAVVVRGFRTEVGRRRRRALR